MSTDRAAAGFTMIELIMVIVLLGAMVVLGSAFVASPFRIAQDVERRAHLADLAQGAINLIARDVRRALPNSIRAFAPDAQGRSSTIELLLTRSGGRYRRQIDTSGGPAGEALNINASVGQFDVLGGLPNVGSIDTSGDCAAGTADCLVLYNTNASDSASPTNAYGGRNRASVSAATASSIGYANAGAGLGFPTHSPNQRFFIVESSVSFRCSGNELRRHSAYPLQAAQSIATGTIGAGSLLADNVSACEFRYREGDASRNGLLSIRLQLTREGESVDLLQQIHIVNSP